MEEPAFLKDILSPLPVLTVKTIEGASIIEYRKVFIAELWSAGIRIFWITSPSPTCTYPVRYTVGGKGIVVPFQIALIW
jgi:hypothetical protein